MFNWIMLGMCKTRQSNKDWSQFLFICVQNRHSLICRTTPSSLVINFEQVIKPFLFKIFISVFSYQWLIAFFTRELVRVTVYHHNVRYAFQSEPALYSFRTSCSKQAQYLKFKWTVTSWKYSRSNIAQTSSLCYVAGF